LSFENRPLESKHLETSLTMILQSLLGFSVFVVIYYNVRYFLTVRRNSRKARELGCQPTYRSHNRFPFGLDKVREEKAAFDNHLYPYLLQKAWAVRHPVTTSESFTLGTWESGTIDPLNIQAILATQFTDFELGDFRREGTEPFLGSGIFTQDGGAWKHSRDILRPQFAREQVKDLTSEERHVQNMFRVLPVGSKGNGWTEEVDIQPLIFALTLDAATEFLLGESANSQLEAFETDSESGKAKRFAAAFDEGTKGTSARFVYGPFAKWIWPKGWASAINATHNTIDSIVSKALLRAQQQELIGVSMEKEEKTRYVFLEELIKDTKDPLELRSQILHILIAGRDTTASTISWAFYELVRQPDMYQRLRNIILHDFGTYSQCKLERDITFAKIKACSYLQYVLNETLRLYPPVLTNERVATKDTTLPRGGGPDGLGKVFIPKGRTVSYSVFLLHRREDLWGKDAEKFRPERWEGRKMGWDYVPVSS
jgi:cytochrome P450